MLGNLKIPDLKVPDAALTKVNQLIAEFNDAVPTMKALGLSISDVAIEFGLLPEIRAKLTGSVDALDAEKIKPLIEKNKDKKILVTVLESLRTASNFKEQLGEVGFKGVEMNIQLGLPPKIAVGLVQ